jgi:hypothetical protein
MTFQEVIIDSHRTLYADGADDLTNLRFFANLAMLMAQRLEAGAPTSEADLMEMIKTAFAIEKELKSRG